MPGHSSEKAWAVRECAALVVALLAVTSLPYVYAWVSVPPDLVYTGFMFDVPDHAQYWSWVTASRDALFISNTMTPEPNPATFMNPMMWLLSQCQLAFGLSFPALFQLWRIGAVVLFVPVLLSFMRVMVNEPERRWLAATLALFGSGLGWIWVVAKTATGASDVAFPHDLYTLEANTFWTMLSYPYLLLADALILATMVGTWLVLRENHWRGYALAMAAAACLSVSHAYDLITVYTVLGTYGLVEWIRTREFPRRLASVGIPIAAVSGPAALYYQQLTSSDPLWRAILSQYSNAGVWTPPHYHLIILMGVPLLLAVVSLLSPQPWSNERRFLAVWAIASLGLVYLPVVYQIKLLSAWQFPIAILAAHAWHERAVPVLSRLVPPRWAVVALVGVVSLTNVYLFTWRFTELRRHAAPYYLHQDDVAALGWLAQNAGPADVVLAPAEIGQFVPNYGESRAYLAHWAMTNRFFERRANVEQFFDPASSDEWRRALLRSEGVTLVLRSEWGLPSDREFDPGQSAGFERVFDRPGAQIYRFAGPEHTAPAPSSAPR